MLLKRRRVVAQLVKEDTEGPDISLLVDGLSLVDIDHLGGTVLQRRVSLYIIFGLLYILERLGYIVASREGGRAEITQFELIMGQNEDILNLERR